MKRISLTIIVMLFVILSVSAQKKEVCKITTSLGEITVELYPEKAPITVANFLKYVDAHLYDNCSFFRAVTLNNQPKDSIKIEVIQGGEIDSTKVFAPIPLETTKQTGISHKNGTLSMARDKPNSATTNFFICINDQPSLDYGGKRNKDGQGFAAFGSVIKGMEIVKKIQQLHPEQDQYFKPEIRIISITRKK
ncbi:peptidyl-prolyl cis-trans isomerase A (cyclophilin A) [Flavobacterium sp. 103]|uniref:peptidylprolyl isomerase n=1 Tax=Flavobacterium sp. 103 TaxID=2135624 RepID=UPI000D5CA520|nr:peptidylprolyl isomerase [Flavobacterium sp. 103]PVX44360.1 peptidyl-prolyl cis-trans isomerase A (cyclophilin A) [Flavobacterium sp. 103]